jgi:polyhydroxybutyrate depolymerase
VAANPLTAWWGKHSKTVIIAVVAIFALYLFAHGSGSAKTSEKDMPTRYESKGRVLLVHAKRNSKKDVPLVLVLPDNNTKTKVFETDSGVSKLANRKNFALVYPEPVAGEWQVDATGPDAQYLMDIITYMSEDWTAVDSKRVYIWGLGEGARMALTLACANPTVFAAVGVVGQFDPDPGPDCQNQIPIDRERKGSWNDDLSSDLWDFSVNKSR